MLFHRRQDETVAIPYHTTTLHHTVLAKNGPKMGDLERMSDLQVRDLGRSHSKLQNRRKRCTQHTVRHT